VTFVLLAGAGLLLASFRHLLAVAPGFTTKGVVTASTNAPGSRYRADEELRILMNRALDSIRRLPGVAAAGATTAIPFGDNDSNSVILAEGHAMRPGESMISPSRLAVTPGYFPNQIYGVRPLDPLVIGGVTVLLAIIGLAACVVPARGAVRVDPVAVLTEL